MAGLRPSGLPRSGLVHRRIRQILQDLLDGEISSIVAAPHRFLRSFDHFIRSRQHIRLNRQTSRM
jgi:hypothetical protein